MIVTCKYTGITITSDHFLVDKDTKVTGIHYLLQLPLSQLNKINHDTRADLGASDAKLLFLAYLYKTKLIRYTAPIYHKTLSTQLATNYLQLVSSIANANAKLTADMPKFASTNDTGMDSLSKYLKLVKDTWESGWLTPELSDRSETRRQKIVKTVANTRGKTNIKAIKFWAESALPEAIAEDKALLFKTVIHNSASFGVSAIKAVKTMALEVLPEFNLNDAQKKQALIEWLDSMIILKADVQIALSSDEADIRELTSELKEIQNTYTIVRKDKTYLNGLTPEVDKLKVLLNAGTKKTDPEIVGVKLPPAPTEEPIESNYSNKLAFMVAKRRYLEGLRK